MLDILEKRGIKVTFFVIGPNVAAHPEIVRRELADGDEIGNHAMPATLDALLAKGYKFVTVSE